MEYTHFYPSKLPFCFWHAKTARVVRMCVLYLSALCLCSGCHSWQKAHEAAVSQFGDVYQLTVNSTGGGNSGGPVMDSRARVIGLFTYAIQGDVRLTFAVPIRYGMELMGTKPVM